MNFSGLFLWFFIASYIGGVLIDRLLHAQDATLTSILNEHKNIEGKSTKLTHFQKAVALIGIGLSFFILIYTLSENQNIITS